MTSISLYTRQKKLKKELHEAEQRLEDMNIEWSGYNGEVCLKKKNYPTEITDDFREEIINETNSNNKEGKKPLHR